MPFALAASRIPLIGLGQLPPFCVINKPLQRSLVGSRQFPKQTL
jgi:hypothetical protein